MPVDIRGHYRYEKIVRSLRTKSYSKASKTAAVWSDHLESIWAGIRLRHLGIGPSFEDVAQKPAATDPSLTAALAIYLKLKGHGRASHYESAARRAVAYAVDTLNDRPINTIPS